jgi:hypothetical protein
MLDKQNGVEYYNIEEHKNNKEEHIATTLRDVSFGRTPSSEATPLSKDTVLAQGSPEPREREVVMEGEEAPLGTHNVKRAIIQLFNNDGGQRKLKIRLNLDDDTNAEFIAPLQPKHNLTNFLRYTADSKDLARDVFVSIRTKVRAQYGVTPQQGKFHERVGARTGGMQTIQVEPRCYGAVAWDQEHKQYVAWIMLYDLLLAEIVLDDDYLSKAQKDIGVRGQHLYINPLFDTRTRPKTWAQKRKERQQ